MLRQLRNNAIAGLIILLPIVATIYILYAVFSTLDRILRPFIVLIFGREIYGLGVVVSFVVIVFAGMFGKNVLGRKLISFSEALMIRIPLVKQIYITVKQISETVFSKSTATAFKQVVMIEYPRKGLYQLGFITGNGALEIESLTGEEILNIFVPTTPNPTSGMLVILPKSDVIVLEMSVEDAIKMILSGGVIIPQSKDAQREK